MMTVEFITALFYEVDEQLRAIPKHPEAHLRPLLALWFNQFFNDAGIVVPSPSLTMGNEYPCALHAHQPRLSSRAPPLCEKKTAYFLQVMHMNPALCT